MKKILPLLLISWLVITLNAAFNPALAASSLAYKSERLSARLITSENAVAPNSGTISMGLQLDLAPGWKTYWKAPGAVGYAPELDWAASANIALSQMLFPAPTRFAAFDIENYGYAKSVTFPIQVTLENAGKAAVISVAANVLVCAELCIPEMFDLSLTLLPGEGLIDTPSAMAIADAAAKVPATMQEAGMADGQYWIAPDKSYLQVTTQSLAPFGAQVQIFVDIGLDAAFGAPEISYSSDRRTLIAQLPIHSLPAQLPPFEITVRDGDQAGVFTAQAPADAAFSDQIDATNEGAKSLFSIALIALLGGLILNIMPCVLPVLTIKFASALKSRDHSNARIRAGFLASAFGVLAFMWALAGTLLAIRAGGGQIGWGVQFQNPIFLAVMITLICVFAANMAGLFEITLPQRFNTSLSQVESDLEQGSGLLGDFTTGAFAAMLATPCSAPFLGTAVTFALAGSALEAMVIFTALGLGLALPYLAIAMRPSWVKSLPKPGPWMVWVKWVMAALLVLTALWLGSVLLLVAGWRVVLVIFALIIVAVLAMLPARRIKMARGVSIALLLAAPLVPLILHPAPQAITQNADWALFDADAIAPAITKGDVVFVDVTASWCLTCKANKARVLNRDPVAEMLTQPGIIAMRADWTQPNQDILDYLKSNGRFGIPFNIVYGPGAPKGIALPEFLTTDAVLSALEKAR